MNKRNDDPMGKQKKTEIKEGLFAEEPEPELPHLFETRLPKPTKQTDEEKQTQ